MVCWCSMDAEENPIHARAWSTGRGGARFTRLEGAMNFDFSDDLKQLRNEARRFLVQRSPPSVVRDVLEGREAYAVDLWGAMAEMGWLGAAIPEQYGGAGLGYEGLCVLAEELGRALAPVPFASSAYLASEAVLLAGSQPQKTRLLPSFADGSAIGCFALAEGS